MQKYYVQFESEIGPYYYTGLENGIPCFTHAKEKAYRFYTKLEAQSRATRFDGKVIREVIV